MKHLLINLLTGLSLVLCLATAALWVRSLWVWDTGTWLAGINGSTMTVVGVDLHAGSARLDAASLTFPPPGKPADLIASDMWSPGWHSYGAEYAVPTSWRDNLWPSYEHATGTTTHGGFPFANWSVLVPYWLPVVITLMLPVWIATRFIRSRRRCRRGRCKVCGYDLRGSPEQCPECGTLAAGAEA